MTEQCRCQVASIRTLLFRRTCDGHVGLQPVSALEPLDFRHPHLCQNIVD